MTQQAQLTQEEQEKLKDEAAAASIRFLQKHLDYARTPEDNQRLGDYIREHKLAWTAENLDIAYQKIGHELQHRTAEEIAANAKTVQAQISAPREPEFPWSEYLPLTKARIASIPREKYKIWIKDQRFVEQINAALRGK